MDKELQYRSSKSEIDLLFGQDGPSFYERRKV